MELQQRFNKYLGKVFNMIILILMAIFTAYLFAYDMEIIGVFIIILSFLFSCIITENEKFFDIASQCKWL